MRKESVLLTTTITKTILIEKKFEQLERQRKIIEDEIDWRTNEKCRLENELKNAGIFCNKALIKDRIAFLKAKIDALCKQVSELK